MPYGGASLDRVRWQHQRKSSGGPGWSQAGAKPITKAQNATGRAWRGACEMRAQTNLFDAMLFALYNTKYLLCGGRLASCVHLSGHVSKYSLKNARPTFQAQPNPAPSSPTISDQRDSAKPMQTQPSQAQHKPAESQPSKRFRFRLKLQAKSKHNPT